MDRKTDRLLLKFRLFLKRKGDKESTIHHHLGVIKRLLRDIRPLNKEETDQFLLSLSDKGLKNNYLNTLIDSLRVFAQFKNLDLGLQKYPYFKTTPPIKAILSDKEIEAFLALSPIKNETKETFKFYNTFFSVMAFTGMRPGEVAKLTINDVDFGRQVFIVKDTKTNDHRFVPIAPNLIPLLKEHLKKHSPLLFPRKTAEKPIRNSEWYYHFHKRIKRLRIKRTNLTCYSLRHSFITRLLNEDVNIFKVQKIVGHRRIETTAHYTHLTTKDIIKAIKSDPLIRRNISPKDILKQLKEMIEAFKLDEDKRFSYRLVESNKGIRISIFLR